jgi:hypothetical protein
MHNAGTLHCISALIPPSGSSLEHQEASLRLCTELAYLLPDIVSMATASNGHAADLAALRFLAVFASHACPVECAQLLRRDPPGTESNPSLLSRLVSLSMLDNAERTTATCLLQQITQKVPVYRREALQGLLAAIEGAETPRHTAFALQALMAVARCPHDTMPSTGVHQPHAHVSNAYACVEQESGVCQDTLIRRVELELSCRSRSKVAGHL